MRAIGSATISFGLVSCPIKIYSIIQDNDVHFNFLHKCGSRVKQQYICADENVVVDRADLIKGYEFAKDQFVQFNVDELKALEERNTYTIDIEEFIPLESIDSIFFEKSYVLAPDKSARSYSLIVAAMQKSANAALAHYTTRGKDQIVMLRAAAANCIVMQTIHYPDEIRSIKDIPLEYIAPKETELSLASQLVDSLSKAYFDPSKYKNNYKERVLKAIDDKIAGKTINIEQPKQETQIVDLLEALKASLQKK